MASNTGQLALLAAGYLLGKSKSMKTVLMVAGGVAYGRLTASRSVDNETAGSLLGGLGGSGIAEAAKHAITSTATKGVETLNKNLQSRSEALRGSSSDEETDQEVDEESTAAEEDAEETEESSSKATKSGDS